MGNSIIHECVTGLAGVRDQKVDGKNSNAPDNGPLHKSVSQLAMLDPDLLMGLALRLTRMALMLWLSGVDIRERPQ